MEKISNDDNGCSPITIIKKYSNLQLSLPASSSSIKLAIKKDERLEYLNISKGLIELLQINSLQLKTY